MDTNDRGKRAHNIIHSHGMFVMGSFDNKNYEICFWTWHGVLLSFIVHKSIFNHFVHHGTKFYIRYIKYFTRTSLLDDDRTGVKAKH